MRKQEKILKCHEINTNDLDPEFKNQLLPNLYRKNK